MIYDEDVLVIHSEDLGSGQGITVKELRLDRYLLTLTHDSVGSFCVIMDSHQLNELSHSLLAELVRRKVG